MSATIEDRDRHVFPRWRDFRSTARLGELSVSSSDSSNDLSSLDRSLARGIALWEKDRSLWKGLDLLGTAVIAGRLSEFTELAREIGQNPRTPALAKSYLIPDKVGSSVSEESTSSFVQEEATRTEIRQSKINLQLSPRDAVEWVELARAYTILGENVKARAAINAALYLAPFNRFVVRSAARYFIHLGELDRAHFYLRSAETIKQDPWLLASEIAVSSAMGKTSKFIRTGKRIVEADFRASDLSELRSTLGSLEIESGNDRGGKKSLRNSLEGANENSVAQIGWLNRRHLSVPIDISAAKPPLLHEAEAWTAFYKSDWQVAKGEALSWMMDQPFASAPAVLSSYILSDILGEYDTAEAILSAALRANPDDAMLRNNMSVTLMDLGRVDEAEVVFGAIPVEVRSNPDYFALRATQGMLEFRKNNPEEGRRLYQQAIKEALDRGIREIAARAALHLAIEEVLARTPEAAAATTRLEEYKIEAERGEVACLIKRLHAEIERVR